MKDAHCINTSVPGARGKCRTQMGFFEIGIYKNSVSLI